MAPYTTVDGDMWDLISYKIYGTEYHRDLLAESNPLYYDVYRFTDGSVLTVPDLPPQLTAPAPPWVALGTP